MVFNYQDVTSELLKTLKPRTREIMERRFGLREGEGETLQAIGDDFGITRERVRQIEAAGLSQLEPKTGDFEPVFNFFINQLQTGGGLREERKYLNVISPGSGTSHVLFLLTLKKGFRRQRENEQFYTLWARSSETLGRAAALASYLVKKLEKKKRPVPWREIEKEAGEKPRLLLGVVEVSKRVRRGPRNLWGLSDWSEIRPRGTKGRAHITLKEAGKPLHFREIAERINEGGLFEARKKIHPQTAHNELIKDPRFVLVGRGTYALREWGYKPGTVSEVIARVLREKGPLSRKEVVEEVLARRLVKRNTVLLNLRNHEEVEPNGEGKYILK